MIMLFPTSTSATYAKYLCPVLSLRFNEHPNPRPPEPLFLKKTCSEPVVSVFHITLKLLFDYTAILGYEYPTS